MNEEGAVIREILLMGVAILAMANALAAVADDGLSKRSQDGLGIEASTLEDDLGQDQEGAETLEVPWHSIDGGSQVSSGGNFELTAIVGQPEPGSLVGGEFSLDGGFMAVVGESGIFEDGFETGDTSRWSLVVSP
jgi:hypothetical protein